MLSLRCKLLAETDYHAECMVVKSCLVCLPRESVCTTDKSCWVCLPHEFVCMADSHSISRHRSPTKIAVTGFLGLPFNGLQQNTQLLVPCHLANDWNGSSNDIEEVLRVRVHVSVLVTV